MRIRNTRAMAMTGVAVSCLAVTLGTVGTAHAAPPAEAKSAAKSALVLGVGHSGVTGTTVPDRVVTLECGSFTPGGDHPRAAGACDDLTRVDGAFSSLVGLNQNSACTMEYNPVTVTVDGYWKSKRVNFTHTFPNPCVKKLNASYLFQF